MLETSNKSLDASGISRSLNDNLRLAPFFHAASTAPLAAMQNDVIYLIGPGGAGKSTAGARLARELGYNLIDLDEYFVAHSGDISGYLCSHTYFEYATRNFTNYLLAMTAISSPTVFVLSSGFMVYPAEIDPGYSGTRDAVEMAPLTFLLMPSFDFEDCVAMIVERQLSRPYLRSNRGSEERRIRERFCQYLALRCQRVSTGVAPERVVSELIARVAANTSLNRSGISLYLIRKT
jgi:shikimate kinase